MYFEIFVTMRFWNLLACLSIDEWLGILTYIHANHGDYGTENKNYERLDQTIELAHSFTLLPQKNFLKLQKRCFC